MWKQYYAPHLKLFIAIQISFSQLISVMIKKTKILTLFILLQQVSFVAGGLVERQNVATCYKPVHY